MDNNLYFIIYTLGNLFMTYIIYRFMMLFYSKKRGTGIKEFILYSLYFLGTSLVHIFIRIPIFSFISSLILIYLLTLNYKGSIRKRISTTILILVIIVCVEMVAILATGYFNLEILEKNEFSSIIGSITTRILTFMAMLIISNFKNISRGDNISNLYWFSIFTIPAGSLYILLTVLIYGNLSPISMLIFVAVVFLINFTVFYLYDSLSVTLEEKSRRMLMEQQNRYYENQLDIMKNSLEITKKMRHDLKNHLTSLYALAAEDNNKDILSYLANITEDISIIDEYSLTGNTVIDSIINFKLKDTKKDNIQVSVDINVPMDINIKSYDMTIILGNLLDNALDAVKKLQYNRFINISMKYFKGSIILNIENSYDGQISKKGDRIQTLKADKDNHGLGLDNIRKTVEKYNGTMEIDYDDSRFYISLIIYEEDSEKEAVLATN